MSANINNSFVNHNEAEALKEMIFNRVRERAESISNDIDTAYTSDIKFEVMDIARKSFINNNNPFAEITTNEIDKPKMSEAAVNKEKIDYSEKTQGAGQKNSMTNYNDSFAQHLIIENMNIARNRLSSKKTFMGALDFLNSQAANSLFKTKGNALDTLA